SSGTCGNQIIDADEVCDGANLNGATCASLGFGTGTLTCKSDCKDYVGTACTNYCAKNCSGRVCGADPACGLSCGTCATGSMCNASGTCELADPDAPTIATLGTSASSLDEGDSVTFTALVTDPQGASDVVGGTLVDPSTGTTYGAF